MIVAGCDVGSLTAEAVLLENGTILGSEIMLVRPTAEQSARDVMEKLFDSLSLSYDDIGFAVATGYGRETIPFANASPLASKSVLHPLGNFSINRA